MVICQPFGLYMPAKLCMASKSCIMSIIIRLHGVSMQMTQRDLQALYRTGLDCLDAWYSGRNSFKLFDFVLTHLLCLTAAVTALDFSQRNPHILGVGSHDGTIAVYDVRSRQPTPLMASTADTGKHSDPVWKVRSCIHLQH
jgi:hypothetical protein